MKRMKRTTKNSPSGIKALAEDLRFRGEILPPTKQQLRKELRTRIVRRNKAADVPGQPDPVVLAPPPDDPTLDPPPEDAITVADATGLQQAFDYLNKVLFEGTLPRNVKFNHQSRAHSPVTSRRIASASRIVAGVRYCEINLNPDHFTGQSDLFIISTLLHEMVHLWQEVFGAKATKRKNYGYHDKEWAAKMEAVGLMPSNTGAIGGKRTGSQMDHFILPGGRYALAFAELEATGWKLKLESTIRAGGTKKPKDDKTKFTCSSCGWNVWGRASTVVMHVPCTAIMLPPQVEPAAQSFDQAAE